MSEQSGGSLVVLSPPAELDFGSAPDFGAAIADALAAHPDRLEVDWSSVVFCDSSGLRVLINAAKHARAVPCQLTVTNPSRALLRLADLLGASDLLRLPPPPRSVP